MAVLDDYEEAERRGGKALSLGQWSVVVRLRLL